MRFKVTMKLPEGATRENSMGYLFDKKDYIGEHNTKEEAIVAWKTLNGLDGIGVEGWPVFAEESNEEAQPEPPKPKLPIRHPHAHSHTKETK